MYNSDGLIVNRLSNIPYSTTQKVSFWALLMWILYPTIAMFLNACNVDGIYVYLIWVYLLYLVGAIGLFLGLIWFVRSKLCDRIVKSSLIRECLPIVLLLLFLCWSSVSCFLAEDRHLAFYGVIPMTSSWFTFLFFGGFVFAGLNISKNKNSVINLSRAFIGVSLIQATITLPNNSISKLFNIVEPYTNCFEYQSVFYNTNHYGYYLLIVILVSLFMSLYSNKIIEKLIYVFSYALNISLLILNNTLGSYLALLLTILFVVIWSFINDEEKKRFPIVMLVIFILTSLLSLFYTDNLKDSIIGMTADVSIVISDENVNSTGSGRGELWKNALECVRSNPLFGCGFENHGAINPSIDTTGEVYASQPHNFLLFYAKFIGIPGLLFYLCTLVVGVKRLLEKRKEIGSITKSAAFIVLGYLVSDFFGAIKFYTAPYYCIMLGICLMDCVNGKNEEYYEI